MENLDQSLQNLASSRTDYVLSQASNLAGTKFGVAPDFPKEIVDIRKSLVPHLKDAKKRGCVAKLVYDKLYINSQLFTG